MTKDRMVALIEAGRADGQCDAFYGREHDHREGNWGKTTMELLAYDVAYSTSYGGTPERYENGDTVGGMLGKPSDPYEYGFSGSCPCCQSEPEDWE